MAMQGCCHHTGRPGQSTFVASFFSYATVGGMRRPAFPNPDAISEDDRRHPAWSSCSCENFFPSGSQSSLGR
ncbi:hypothetical protein PpBr36_04703 [Pyricularia pennisetigena]|uniref:hypothetical protein n=1 Tax=Pyricularia pennisetigena TaxID=1578925 RepID=UPI0011544941|nr:hypothetical protein PpBr36_04703 [Pyricularia pennisetigena]TLS26333.1 hypothetical protein PpBr36_04703 [Pyricularia pennisetigena]